MGERVSKLLAGRWGWLAVAALAIFYLLLNPIGFTGGGADDSRYLDAARCWAANGAMCLPDNHWASRWPALAPIAAGIWLFGEGRSSIGLGTLAGWIASIALVGLLGRLWFDRATGLLAAALFASIPIVSAWATQPSVDLIELALQLGALALATSAYRQQSAGLAVAAGVAAALAVQSRETSLIFCGVAALAWVALDRERRGVLLWALAGFGGSLAAEMIAYEVATGDPLARYRLSLGHVAIPSPELQPWVDTSRSPLLNPDYIAGWKRSAGIEIWWPIDPWLNLLASPVIGFWLIAAIGMGLVSKGEGRIIVGRIALGAGLVAVLLVYGLAVDPKPRMFLLAAAAAAVVMAWATMGFVRRGNGMVPIAVVVVLLALGVMIIARLPDTKAIEGAAQAWIAAHPGRIESDARTIGALTLLP
ncbi:MAG TPA: glycosyltransferase family 39 protein, partial [Sphingomicrobium sp.]|nr:glycosyltransferase family 39 protein [Sphingomicrobium sp.]